jgi:hypothetical protein
MVFEAYEMPANPFQVPVSIEEGPISSKNII